MQQFDLYHSGFLALAVVLEIFANILLKMSDGFRKLWLACSRSWRCSARLAPCHRP